MEGSTLSSSNFLGENMRNERCPCGSGKKFKKCCGLKAQQEKQKSKNSLFDFAAMKQASQLILKKKNVKVLGSEENKGLFQRIEKKSVAE